MMRHTKSASKKVDGVLGGAMDDKALAVHLRRGTVKSRLGLLGLLLAFMVTKAVFAQSVVPTDLDLRTAYCARVIAYQLAGMQQMMGGEPENSPAYPFVQKSLKEQADILHRLQSYLLPKLSSLEPGPLIAAAKRADADLEEVSQAGAACGRKCEGELQSGRPGQRWATCVDVCMASPLTTRVRACRTPDWLPF